MAIKACLFLNLLGIKLVFRPAGCWLIVFRGLEGESTPFVGHVGNLIIHLPVRADRKSMALIAAAGRWNTFPGGEHGTTANRNNQSRQG